MAYDERYYDNVVLKKDAFQNLLTNIKNYPIIDIENIKKEDKDEIHAGKSIWETWNGKTPCIKVIYGDERNPRGNDFNNEISKEKKKVKAAQYQLNKRKYRLAQLEEASRQLKIIADEKVIQAEAIKQKWNEIISNREQALIVLCNLLIWSEHQRISSGGETAWIISKYIPTPPSVSFSYNKITYLDNTTTPAKTITITIPRLERPGDIVKQLETLRDTKYPNGSRIFEDTDSQKPVTVINRIRNFVLNFNQIIFREIIENNIKNYASDLEVRNGQIFSESLTAQNPNGDQVLTILQRHLDAIKNDLNKPNTFPASLEDLEDSSTAFSLTATQLSNVVNYIKNVIGQNQTYLTQEATILNGNDATNEETIAYWEAQVQNAKQNYEDKIAEIISDTDKRTILYGYRYIPVGHTLNWNANFDNTNFNYTQIKTDTSNDQASGTFRITMNNDVFEIPIKGFGAKSNKEIQLSTTENIAISSDKTMTINSKGNSTITSDGTIVTHSKGNTTIRAKDANDTLKNITLDGNTIINGTFNPKGKIVNNLIPNTNSISSSTGYNLGDSSNQWSVLYTRAAIFGNKDKDAGNVRPYTDKTGTIGTSNYRWNAVYAVDLGSSSKQIEHAYIMSYNTIQSENKGGPSGSYISADKGYFNTLYINGNEISAGPLYEVTNGGTTAQFWRGGDSNNNVKPGWSNTLTGSFTLDGTGSNLSVGGTATISGAATIGGKVIINNTNGVTEGTVPTTDSSLYSKGGAYFTKNVYGARVFNAVFNDYAEYRTTINLEPGRVVVDNDNGSLSCSSQRLQPGAQVISDTFGHSMGYTENCQTPLAVAGRVLTYTYQDRNNYHAGMAVCSAPNGTVDIMTREEIKEYPDCIIGIVSEIPQYETWGTNKVKVNDRIWIKIK